MPEGRSRFARNRDTFSSSGLRNIDGNIITNICPNSWAETVTGKLKRIQQLGVRGVTASVLSRAANWVGPARTENHVGQVERNEFLAWVRFAVPGMLDPGNIEAMEHAVANMPPDKPILEIGSFCGLSTVVLSYLLEKHSSAAMFSCDKWEFEGQQLGAFLGDSQTVSHQAYQAYAKETFLRTMQTFAGNRLPYTIECLSDEFFRRWFENDQAIDVFGRGVKLGGAISFCYIDGNHTYEFAKRDFQNTDRALAPGGYVLFDDSADGSDWEVNTLTREIAADPRYELISKNPNYLFRKKF